MWIPLRFVVLAAAIAAIPASGSAQILGGEWPIIEQWDGTATAERLGTVVANAGDVNGDGVPDMIVSAPGAAPGGLFLAGSAFVYSGSDGGVLHRFDGEAAINFLTAVDGAGDINGDGFADLIVGAAFTTTASGANAGTAWVYSGADGSLLHRFDGAASNATLGSSVAGAGDVDGDGVGDLIVGAPSVSVNGLFKNGAAYVFSGATGNLLHRFDGSSDSARMGFAVDGAGDVNGDGQADLIVGEPLADFGGNQSGRVTVYSGASGDALYIIDGGSNYNQQGGTVRGAGDLDLDGYDDFCIAPTDPSTNPTTADSVSTYSGRTGALLHNIVSISIGGEIGRSIGVGGDIDGDGFLDLAFGSNGFGDGLVYLHRGIDGELIQVLDPVDFGPDFGAGVDLIHDLDGDGLAEILVGAPLADPGSTASGGSARLFSLDPYLHPDALSLSVSGGATVTMDLAFPASEAGARYAVLASLSGTGPERVSGLDVPLTRDPIFRAILIGNAPAPLVGAYGVLDGNALAQAALQAAPALATAIGQTVHFAAVTYDVGPTAGRLTSIARGIKILP